MKKVIGLVLLLVVLVAVSGCTQQTKTATATTVAPTAVATPIETTVEVTTAEVTTEIPVENTTVAANETVAQPTTEATAAAAAVTAAMTPSTKVTVIHIANNTFTPATLMVLPGTGITWVNDDNTVHSVKMVGEHAGKFNSGDLVAGARWGYSFGDAEGTFQYADGYNLNVTGTIIVKKGDSLVGNVPVTTVTGNNTW
jgi:plastocyanin